MIERISSLVDPSVSVNNVITDTLTFLDIEINIIDEYTNLVISLKEGTGDIRTAINNILRQLGCSEITEDIKGIVEGGSDFPSIVSALKQLAMMLSDKCTNRESKRRFDQIKFLFDTCYNRTKAERLKKALDELENRLGSDLFKKFLVLLAAVLARSAKDFNYFLRAE